MSLPVEQISARYGVRRLTEADVPDIYALCKGNPTYYQHMKCEPTYENITQDLTALPPNKTLADKYFLGYCQGRRLLAILDLITGYPTRDTAFIGWFMVDKSAQGAGLGTELITELLAFLRAAHFRHVRLGYIKGNPESRAFWEKNRFLPTGIETQTGDYTVVVLQRDL